MRLFFGAEVSAPWPKELPHGKIVQEEGRHMTLAFLGDVSLPGLLRDLQTFPTLPFPIGIIAKSDKILFLPEETPRVVAWHVKFLEKMEEWNHFYAAFTAWLQQKNYRVEKRPFMAHVTVARFPFVKEEWEKVFSEIPVVIKAIHLYESCGNLTYESRWSLPLILPYEEIEHTADIAFIIRGMSIQELSLHAQAALASKFPSLTRYFSDKTCTNLDDVVIVLNEVIAAADKAEGCPFKAVSFHGNVTMDEKGLLSWEMIIDV